MLPFEVRRLAFRAWDERVRLHRRRPFPTDWAKVVAGVGLASFTMRVEDVLAHLPQWAEYKAHYLHSLGVPQSIVPGLHDLLPPFDRFLPSLPPEPRRYFEDLRSLVVEAIELTDRWWTLDAAGSSADAGNASPIA